MRSNAWLDVVAHAPLSYFLVFPLGEDERQLYREGLVCALSMDTEGFQRFLESGGAGMLKRYSPERYVYGIHLFLRDLSEVRKGHYAERPPEEFYAYVSRFVPWAAQVGLDDPVKWIKDTPEFDDFVRSYQSYYWVGVYRMVLAPVPERYRGFLDSLARLMADFQTERELVWLADPSDSETKAQRVGELFERYKALIVGELDRLGLPPQAATPMGFDLCVLAESFGDPALRNPVPTEDGRGVPGRVF